MSIQDESLATARSHPMGPVAEHSEIKQIWAVGGGKGGVGKSLIASSLGISLARLGFKIIVADFDLGGANLHTTLGVDLPKRTLSDFFTNRVPELQSCVVPTGIQRLEIISGAQDAITVANIKREQKAGLLKSLRSLNADYLILDLGAGTSFNTLDFFIAADIGILSMLPEPTSIENAYRFIKSVYYRRLTYAPSLEPIRDLIDLSADPQNLRGIRSPSDFFQEVTRSHPSLALELKRQIEKFRPKLVINQARTQTDIDIGFSVRSVCKRYFGIDLDYAGYLDYDSAVWQAVRRKRPPMLEFPNSKLVSSFDKIASYLLRRYGQERSEPLLSG